jgi:hypothetical protein
MWDSVGSRSIEISAQRVLTAVPDGRCWLMQVNTAELTAFPVSTVAAQRLSLAASLIEGAICAGLTEGEQVGQGRPHTFLRYIKWLAGNYAFAGQTPNLFRRGAQRFEAVGRSDLAIIARKKAVEEEGHADLAYQDLQALGLPAAEVVELIQPPSACAFAHGFLTHVESNDPIGLFGFSYCLERMALERDVSFIRNIEMVCPRGSKANRFLNVHSSIGSDSAHVHDQLALFESFTSAELTVVIRAAYASAAMLSRQHAMDALLTDDEMERRLRLAGIEVNPVNIGDIALPEHPTPRSPRNFLKMPALLCWDRANSSH